MHHNSVLGCLLHLLLIALAHGRGLKKEDGPTRNVLVTMVAGTDTAINQAMSAMQDGKSSHASIQRGSTAGREMLVQMLEDQASTSQADVFSLLTGNVTAAANDTYSTAMLNSVNEHYESTTSFWISNQVFIKGATEDLIAQLKSLPSVASVETEIIVPLPPFEKKSHLQNSSLLQSVQWGISNIKADQVWNRFTGKGVVVGIIDTGVRCGLLLTWAQLQASLPCCACFLNGALSCSLHCAGPRMPSSGVTTGEAMAGLIRCPDAQLPMMMTAMAHTLRGLLLELKDTELLPEALGWHAKAAEVVAVLHQPC